MNADLQRGPAVEITLFGGNCPFQAEGNVDGQPFYFRSRGQRWSMSIGGVDVLGTPDWYYEEPYGEKFEAGWITEEQAQSFMDQAFLMWQNREMAPKNDPDACRNNELTQAA